MSSAADRPTATDFDAWLADMVRQHHEFTALVVLAGIGHRQVAPLCSTFLHVVGDDARWDDFKAAFEGAGEAWDGAAFFPTKSRDGGLIDNETARSRLAELEARIRADRMVFNDGHFFNTDGQRIEIEPVLDA